MGWTRLHSGRNVQVKDGVRIMSLAQDPNSWPENGELLNMITPETIVAIRAVLATGDSTERRIGKVWCVTLEPKNSKDNSDKNLTVQIPQKQAGQLVQSLKDREDMVLSSLHSHLPDGADDVKLANAFKIDPVKSGFKVLKGKERPKIANSVRKTPNTADVAKKKRKDTDASGEQPPPPDDVRSYFGKSKAANDTMPVNESTSTGPALHMAESPTNTDTATAPATASPVEPQADPPPTKPPSKKRAPQKRPAEKTQADDTLAEAPTDAHVASTTVKRHCRNGRLHRPLVSPTALVKPPQTATSRSLGPSASAKG